MPSAIVNLLIFNNNVNSHFIKAPIKHTYKSKSSITSNSGIFLYWKIDENLKTKNFNILKKLIKYFIGDNLPIYRMVQPSDYGWI